MELLIALVVAMVSCLVYLYREPSSSRRTGGHVSEKNGVTLFADADISWSFAATLGRVAVRIHVHSERAYWRFEFFVPRGTNHAGTFTGTYVCTPLGGCERRGSISFYVQQLCIRRSPASSRLRMASGGLDSDLLGEIFINCPIDERTTPQEA